MDSLKKCQNCNKRMKEVVRLENKTKNNFFFFFLKHVDCDSIKMNETTGDFSTIKESEEEEESFSVELMGKKKEEEENFQKSFEIQPKLVDEV